MNLNESSNRAIIDLINEKGLTSATRFFGGYDTLVKLLGDYEITKDLMIKEIRDLVKKVGMEIVFSDNNEEPIPYKEEDDIYEEIEGLGLNNVTIIKWLDRDTFVGHYEVHYLQLPYKTITDIFRVISDMNPDNIV